MSRVNLSLEFWIIALRLGFRVGFLDLGLEMSFGMHSHGSILEHSRLLANNRAITLPISFCGNECLYGSNKKCSNLCSGDYKYC